MKKKFLLSVLITSMLLTGCSMKSDEQKIKDYVKENSMENWKYSDDKVSIDKDLNLTIKLYGTIDTESCYYSSKYFLRTLLNNKTDLLNEKKVTMVCYNNEDYMAKVVVNDVNKMDFDLYDYLIELHDKDGLNTDINTKLESIKTNYISQAKVVKYDELYSNIDKYVGTKVKFSGVINTALEQGNFYLLVIEVSQGKYLYTYAEKESFKTEIKEKDTVEFYGTVEKMFDMEVEDGKTITAPYLEGRYFVAK